MVLHSHQGSARDYIDGEHGTISREIYVNPDIYARELERIFARTWTHRFPRDLV